MRSAHLLSAPPRLVFGVCVGGCSSLHTARAAVSLSSQEPLQLVGESLLPAFFCSQWHPVLLSSVSEYVHHSLYPRFLPPLSPISPSLTQTLHFLFQGLFCSPKLSSSHLCLFHSLCFFLPPSPLESSSLG